MANTETRPRRSTRASTKTPAILEEPSSSSAPQKPGKKPRDAEAEIERLLTNAKSKLTAMDISVGIAGETWDLPSMRETDE